MKSALLKSPVMKLKLFISLTLLFSATACLKVELFEKNVEIPHRQWDYKFKPTVQFNIEDTVSAYDLFIVIRHTDAYNFNNIWLNLYIQAPGEAQTSQQIDIPLASNEKGWLGKGMDDIFEHRYKITRQPIAFRKAGTYSFTLEQIMRENPLEHVLDVGLRVEKSH
jgi:gliding motility-associated lipoprotein GldH